MNLKQKQAIEKIFASKKISDDVKERLADIVEGLREKS